MEEKPHTPYYAKSVFRLLSGAFGLFLFLIGLYSLCHTSEWSITIVLPCLFMVFLGGDAVLSAIQAKEPWLSTIGPLP